jgi:hypothetical protein
MQTGDTIIGTPRGTAAEALDFARAEGSKRIDDVEAYLDEVYAFAPQVGIDPAIVVAQSALETSNWRDDHWRNNLNPAGMGVTDDFNFGHGWISGADAARGQMVHLWVYAKGKLLHGQLAPFAHLDPRRDALEPAWYGANRTLQSLGGKWSTVLDYGQRIANRSRDIFPALPDQREPTVSTKPYILVTAGHRFTEDDGNPDERARTDDLAIAYVQAFRDAGYIADWWQRDLDDDANPTMTVGFRATVAKGCARVVDSRPEEISILLDLHFDGKRSSMHAVVPDAIRPNGKALDAANVDGGAPADDTAAFNTLDVSLGHRITNEIVAATGLKLHQSKRLRESGVMSELDTGQGGKGNRLGMFVYTARVRKRCVRLVLEHGGFEDAPTLVPGFEERCAAAAVSAVTEVFAERERAADPAAAPVEELRPEIPRAEPEFVPVL